MTRVQICRVESNWSSKLIEDLNYHLDKIAKNGGNVLEIKYNKHDNCIADIIFSEEVYHGDKD